MRLKIEVDIFLRLTTIYAQLFGQAKGRHAVDQAEVDGLGVPALIVADFVEPDREHFRCGCPMDVLIAATALEQGATLAGNLLVTEFLASADEITDATVDDALIDDAKSQVAHLVQRQEVVKSAKATAREIGPS